MQGSSVKWLGGQAGEGFYPVDHLVWKGKQEDNRVIVIYVSWRELGGGG